ncbi:MAG: BACON domain-containing protein [Bacteroidales bacterium]|nr:BACON domain-containing protein [Bacteroidales bacterium]
MMKILRNLFLPLLVLPLLFSCQKEYTVVNDLAVSSRMLEIKSTAGATHIMVYSNGPWTVRLERAVEWAALDKLSGEGLGDFVLHYSTNYGIKRGVYVILEADGKTEAIHVVQAGAITSPDITFDSPRVVLPRQGTSYSIPMTTNLTFCLEEIKARAVYYDAQGYPTLTAEIGTGAEGAWVSAYSVSEENVTFTVDDNATGEDRVADVVYYVKDASGAETRTVVSLVQSKLDPSFTLSSTSGSYYANNSRYSVPATVNNIWSSPETRVTSDCDWVSGAALDESGLVFTVD